MGFNKALYPLADGKPMICHLAKACEGFRERLLSTNVTLSVPGFIPLKDECPGQGPLDGILTALHHCRSRALLVLSCDLPFYTSALGDWLCSFSGSGWPAWIAKTRDNRSHYLCGVYTKEAIPMLEDCEAQGERRMWAAFERLHGYPLSLRDTVFPDYLLTNLNTPQDLAVLSHPPVLAVCGWHNSGKTTLCEQLIRCLSENGLRVAAIKHDGHDFTPDVPGTDSFRLQKAGANPTAVYSNSRFLYTQEGSPNTQELFRTIGQNADLILLEGGKSTAWPKLEVLCGDQPAASPPVIGCVGFGAAGAIPCFSPTDYRGITRFIIERFSLRASE